jgi:2,4-dienoyl-CoA reductase-like NADH-dependent reductase (Old Yellow Enzyme family)
MSPHDNDR